jgi:predicted phage baseplate assembly protein
VLPCGCCEGVGVVTPLSVASRPGLAALRYRVGTHAAFLDTMLARLSSSEFPALRGLSTRDPSDFSIALLDGWATIADVLTFYQERIANEGYLHTATEARSVLELARLVGYELRPGVAASVYLAYTLDDGHDVVIPAGSRVQSVPGPGELPQPFETSEPLNAHAALNVLRPRLTRPQVITRETRKVWFGGIATGLQKGDGILVDLGDGDNRYFERVAAVDVDHEAQRTLVTLGTEDADEPGPAPIALRDLVRALVTSARAQQLLRRGKEVGEPPAFPSTGAGGDRYLRLLSNFRPDLAHALTKAVASAPVTEPQAVRVYAMRTKASVFGHNAPLKVTPHTNAEPTFREWTFFEHEQITEVADTVNLDASYDKVLPNSWVVIDYNAVDRDVKALPPKIFDDAGGVLITRARRVNAGASRAQYGMSGPTTVVVLDDEWLDRAYLHNRKPGDEFEIVRKSAVFVQSEELTLAEEPIPDDVCGTVLELDALYDGLDPGRALVVSGERADVDDTPGVLAAELVRVAAVAQVPTLQAAPRPGDMVHSFVLLDGNGLDHCYERATLSIYGNVVHATHGETRAEVLGSGDATVPFPRFTLRQSPLTYVSAPTPSGVQSSLEVRVNEVRWPARASLAELGSTDRGYITRTEDASATTVVFGDGTHGRRLPTGIENVRAGYRNGIGKGGNLDIGRLTQLATKPLGVKDVNNPIPATGGADADSRDQAKVNVPASLKAFDRLVSLADYADFARVFAGVGKATATRLTAGHRRVVFVTVAGVDDIPIDESSDLLVNLRRALHRFGDPDLAVEVGARRLLLADLTAGVRLHPDYDWTSVEPNLRAALVAALGFDHREIGQDLSESEVLAIIQQQPGVVSVWLDSIGALSYDDGLITPVAPFGLDETPPFHPGRRVVAEEAAVDPTGEPVPAQLLYLSATVTDTLTLKEVNR